MRWVTRLPVVAIALVFGAGVAAWGAFNWALEITNTETFCVSCHAMRTYVFPELSVSRHYTNRSGVRASCPDCHVPRVWVHKVARKVAATKELFHWMRGTIDTPEKFAARKPVLAQRVWATMTATDSRECRNCHGGGFMDRGQQTPTARAMHDLGDAWGHTCIDCHKGIAHSLPADFDPAAEMDLLHDRMTAEDVDCRLCHTGMAGPPPDDDWD